MRAASVVAALASSSAALAADAPSGLSCRVEGYDVALLNHGDAPVAEGTVVHWSVPFARAQGSYEFLRPLAPGGIVMIGGALGSSYLGPGTDCRIGPADPGPSS